jgi:hypothetical protein
MWVVVCHAEHGTGSAEGVLVVAGLIFFGLLGAHLLCWFVYSCIGIFWHSWIQYRGAHFDSGVAGFRQSSHFI